MQRFRKHINPATVLALAALVFAVTGGAYAASSDGGNGGSHATAQAAKAKSKKKSSGSSGKPGPRGPQGLAGPTGPQGPTGPAGAAGAEGKSGASGSNGKDGSNGESVKISTEGECAKFSDTGGEGKVCNGKPGTNGSNGESVKVTSLNAHNGLGHCEESGGAEFYNKSGEAWACNGSGGSGGGHKLAKGETETGVWSATVTAELGPDEFAALDSIAYPIPLESVPTLAYITEAKKTDPAEGCSGTAAKPEAGEGKLCIYATDESNLGTGGAEVGSSTTGSVFLVVNGTKGGFGFGTWAVTAG